MKCSTCGQMDCMDHGGDMKPLPKLKMAKGGEAEMDEMPDMDMGPDEAPMDDMGSDDELNDMVADEFFDAIEKKDKAALLEALRALVMNMGDK